MMAPAPIETAGLMKGLVSCQRKSAHVQATPPDTESNLDERGEANEHS